MMKINKSFVLLAVALLTAFAAEAQRRPNIPAKAVREPEPIARIIEVEDTVSVEEVIETPIEVVVDEEDAAEEGQWVDMGLPSGTKWKDRNEPGYVDYASAVAAGAPTKAQWKELKEECLWYYSDGVYTVKGPNGKTIDLPTEGYYNCSEELKGGKGGYYWSSTPRSDDEAFYTMFSSGTMLYVGSYFPRCSQLSLRLVMKP